MDKRTQLYLDLQEASKEQIAENITAHKLQSVRIKNAVGRRQDLKAMRPQASLPKIPLDFLAIGDSWFEYPLSGNGLPYGNTAIAARSQLGSMGSPPPQILNMALHGQPTTAMLSYKNQEALIAVLQDPQHWLNQATGSPDAILVSAGGDDLVGDQFAIYLDYEGSGLNLSRLQGALDSVQASYLDLFAFRDIFAKGVPIVGHCYDYAVPNGVHPLCVPSGWVQPSVSFAGYDYNEGLNIVSQMIDKFHAMLTGLAANPSNNFSFVDTRNTLTRDASEPLGWANEIHPFPTGFYALASKFLKALRAMPQFSNRI